MPFIIYLLLVIVNTPISSFAQTDFVVSNSIIIVKGARSLISESTTEKIRGILASIDWEKIPDLGFPKDETHTIKILKRQTLSFRSNIIEFAPSIWRFIADSWSVDYIGSIPYLENLEFLPMLYKDDLSTLTTVEFIQNNLGYYRDKNSLIPGVYQTVSEIADNTVSVIYIISDKENQDMYNQIQLFDQVPPKIIVSSNQEVMQPITNNTETSQNTIEEASTTNKVMSNQNDVFHKEEHNKTISTSIDKKNNRE